MYGIAVPQVAGAHRSAACNRAEPVPEIPDSSEMVDGPYTVVTKYLKSEEDAEELDNLLADADRALHQKLRAPAVISFEVCGIESIEDEYIDQLLRAAEAHLRRKLGTGDADRFKLA